MKARTSGEDTMTWEERGKEELFMAEGREFHRCMRQKKKRNKIPNTVAGFGNSPKISGRIMSCFYILMLKMILIRVK